MTEPETTDQTLPVDLGVDRAIELAKEAVAVRGADYIYTIGGVVSKGGVACKYVTNENGEDECSCIVGCILHKAGVPLAALTLHEGNGIGESVWGDVVTLTPAAKYFLQEIQGLQDDGCPWGAAVLVGENRARKAYRS